MTLAPDANSSRIAFNLDLVVTVSQPALEMLKLFDAVSNHAMQFP